MYIHTQSSYSPLAAAKTNIHTCTLSTLIPSASFPLPSKDLPVHPTQTAHSLHPLQSIFPSKPCTRNREEKKTKELYDELFGQITKKEKTVLSDYREPLQGKGPFLN